MKALFSFTLFQFRAHRGKVNAPVMKDPRVPAVCDPEGMPVLR